MKTREEIFNQLNLSNPILTSKRGEEEIILTEDERISVISQWVDNYIEDQFSFSKMIENGFDVQPENIKLGLSDNDRASFSQMLSLVKEALDLGLITNDSPQIISDINGEKHQVTTLRFRQIMVQYGFYYKSLWDQKS